MLRNLEILVAVLLMTGGIGGLELGRNLGKCRDALGMESGNIPDTALSASSSQYSRTAWKARIRTDGDAWCPTGIITPDTYTFLQVDLPSLTVVTRLETRGRRKGHEFTEAFIVEFQRDQEETTWRRFYQKNGKEEYVANTNQYDSVFQDLDPPLIARRIRLVPFVRIPKRICLTVELYGCPWEDAVLSYQIPQGHTFRPSSSTRPVMLDDLTYDGTIDHRSRTLENGLGKLTDFENGNLRWKRRVTPWVGWNRKELKNALQIIFEFNGTRNISQVNFFSLVSKMDKIDIFAAAVFEFSQDGKRYGPGKEVHNYAGSADNKAFPVLVPVKNAVCRFLRVTLEYSREAEWILISEVYIISKPAFISPQQTVQNQKSVQPADDNKSKQSERRNAVGDILIYQKPGATSDSGANSHFHMVKMSYLLSVCVILLRMADAML